MRSEELSDTRDISVRVRADSDSSTPSSHSSGSALVPTSCCTKCQICCDSCCYDVVGLSPNFDVCVRQVVLLVLFSLYFAIVVIAIVTLTTIDNPSWVYAIPLIVAAVFAIAMLCFLRVWCFICRNDGDKLGWTVGMGFVFFIVVLWDGVFAVLCFGANIGVDWGMGIGGVNSGLYGNPLVVLFMVPPFLAIAIIGVRTAHAVFCVIGIGCLSALLWFVSLNTDLFCFDLDNWVFDWASLGNTERRIVYFFFYLSYGGSWIIMNSVLGFLFFVRRRQYANSIKVARACMLLQLHSPEINEIMAIDERKCSDMVKQLRIMVHAVREYRAFLPAHFVDSEDMSLPRTSSEKGMCSRAMTWLRGCFRVGDDGENPIVEMRFDSGARRAPGDYSPSQRRRGSFLSSEDLEHDEEEEEERQSMTTTTENADTILTGTSEFTQFACMNEEEGEVKKSAATLVKNPLRKEEAHARSVTEIGLGREYFVCLYLTFSLCGLPAASARKIRIIDAIYSCILKLLHTHVEKRGGVVVMFTGSIIISSWNVHEKNIHPEICALEAGEKMRKRICGPKRPFFFKYLKNVAFAVVGGEGVVGNVGCKMMRRFNIVSDENMLDQGVHLCHLANQFRSDLPLIVAPEPICRAVGSFRRTVQIGFLETVSEIQRFYEISPSVTDGVQLSSSDDDKLSHAWEFVSRGKPESALNLVAGMKDSRFVDYLRDAAMDMGKVFGSSEEDEDESAGSLDE